MKPVHLIPVLLAGAAALCLAGCQPAQPSSQPESESQSAVQLETTRLPCGWEAEEFSIACFDKYGPGDRGTTVTLTEEEQQTLLGLLDTGSWETLPDESLPQYGVSARLVLSDGGSRLLTISGPMEGDRTLLTLEDSQTGEVYHYTAPAALADEAGSLRETVYGRLTAALPQGKAELADTTSIPAVLTGSARYQEALEDPAAVILWNGEPITGRTAVDAFVQAMQTGGPGELVFYRFNPGYDENGAADGTLLASRTRLTADNGRFSVWNGDLSDGTSAFGDPGLTGTGTDLRLTDAGYLTWTTDDGVTDGLKALPDSLVWPDGARRRQLYKHYLEPIFYTGALGTTRWDSPQELSCWLALFEDLYRFDHGVSPFAVYGTDWPLDAMNEQLSRYFEGIDVREHLGDSSRMYSAYDPASDTIHYEGGRGGGPVCLRVTGWEENGDQLTLRYESYDYYTGETEPDSQALLTVRLMEDGSFRYLSNRPA